MNVMPTPGALLVNRIFDELSIGETASLVRLVKPDDIKLFIAMSGDVNPAHLDAQYAANDIFGHVVIHGMWTGALISTLLGTELPGPGTLSPVTQLFIEHAREVAKSLAKRKR